MMSAEPGRQTNRPPLERQFSWLKFEIPAPIFRDLKKEEEKKFFSPIGKPQPQEEEKYFRKAGSFFDSFAVFTNRFRLPTFVPAD
jgi:hypothetical protein